MAVLKLPKLPDRTPVKVSLSLNPELHRLLLDYSEAYRVAYGETKAEPITEIIPAILQRFLESDRGFLKARKKGPEETSEISRQHPSARATRNAQPAAN